jgi:hypothetical protein
MPVGTELHLVHEDPGIDHSAHGLDKERADDRFLAAVIGYRERRPDETIVVLTGDLALQLKCEAHSISVHGLPEEYLLPQELTEEERRVAELERELKELRGRDPVLQVVFSGGSQTLRVQLEPGPEEPTLSVAAKMELVKEKYSERPLVGSALSGAAGLFSRVSTESISEYNGRVRRYHAEYADYLRALGAWEVGNPRTVELVLAIENSGGAPGREVRVCLDVPDGAEVFDEPRECPEPPEPPAGPLLFEPSLRYLIPPPAYPRPASLAADPTPPVRITRTNSYRLEWEPIEARHGESTPLAPVWLVLEAAGPQDLHIPYTIWAANLRAKQCGRLVIAIASGPQPTKEDSE